ncbi:MAG: RNA polymerase sigma factor, partial [Ruminococcus sp.]
MKITQELIQQAINKDDFAISELYERTYDDVYRDLFLYIKGNNEVIYNAITDGYIKAFNKITQLKKPQSFLPWVKTIARHCAIDYLRKEKPNMFNESFDALNEQYDEEGNNYEANLPDDNAVIPIEDLDKKETSRLMQEIIDSIPEEQRCVITLFYYDGLSIKEIAKELGCSENTVKSRLSYGKKKIEKEVLELEKKGTKLYGLAPVPFFMSLLKSYSSIAIPQLPSGIITAIQGGVTGLTVSSVTSTAASVAGKTAALTASKGITVKVVAGIIAGVMVVTGGIVGGKMLYDNVTENDTNNSAPTSV